MRSQQYDRKMLVDAMTDDRGARSAGGSAATPQLISGFCVIAVAQVTQSRRAPLVVMMGSRQLRTTT